MFPLLAFVVVAAITYGRGLAPSDYWRPCDRLGPWACMHRAGCVLELGAPPGGSGYQCRAAAGACERDLPPYLDDDYPAQCAARPACVWTEASCFCGCAFDPVHPCNCVCGGGPPGRCEPKP